MVASITVKVDLSGVVKCMKDYFKMASLSARVKKRVWLVGGLLVLFSASAWATNPNEFVLECVQVNGLAEDSFLLRLDNDEVRHLEPDEPAKGSVETTDDTYVLKFIRDTYGTLWEWRINRLTGEYFWEMGKPPLFSADKTVREKNRFMWAWGECAKRNSEPKF